MEENKSYGSKLYDELIKRKMINCCRCKICYYEHGSDEYMYKCYVCNNNLCFNCYDYDDNRVNLEYHSFSYGWIIPNEDENQSICDECVKSI